MGAPGSPSPRGLSKSFPLAAAAGILAAAPTHPTPPQTPPAAPPRSDARFLRPGEERRAKLQKLISLKDVTSTCLPPCPRTRSVLLGGLRLGLKIRKIAHPTHQKAYPSNASYCANIMAEGKIT